MERSIILFLFILLLGCDSLFVDDANFDASEYDGGILGKIHYETYLEHKDDKGRYACESYTVDFIKQVVAVGEAPQWVIFHAYDAARKHSIPMINGMLYDSGYVTDGYYEAFPIEELKHHGTYTVITDYSPLLERVAARKHE